MVAIFSLRAPLREAGSNFLQAPDRENQSARAAS